MPEKTPTLIEKKGTKITEWRAQWENGVTWTELVNDIPELHDPKTPTDTPPGK
jgi:hypothetical protein